MNIHSDFFYLKVSCLDDQKSTTSSTGHVHHVSFTIQGYRTNDFNHSWANLVWWAIWCFVKVHICDKSTSETRRNYCFGITQISCCIWTRRSNSTHCSSDSVTACIFYRSRNFHPYSVLCSLQRLQLTKSRRKLKQHFS